MPGDKAHHAIGVAAQDRCPAAVHRIHDGVQCRCINILERLGAIQPIGEAIQRRLLIGAPAHHPFGPFALGDVARNLRGADDRAVFVPYRRNGQRNVDDAAVLAAPDSLKVLDALAAPDTLQDSRFFIF